MTRLEISDVVAVNKQATIKVSIRPQGTEVAASVGIKYDTNVFDFVKATTGTKLPKDMFLEVNPADDGRIELEIDGSTPIKKSATFVDLLILTFKVVPNAPKGKYAIEFGGLPYSTDNISDANADSVPFEKKNGSITVK